MPGTSGPSRPEPPDGLLEIGHITRPHGIRGEVVVVPVTNRSERFEDGAVHRTPVGDLTVSRARRHQGRWVVAYAEIADRNAAETHRGTVLWGEPIEVLDEGEWWVHELVGSVVIDAEGVERGTVTAVEVNPAHDILVLDTGALVPVVFVTEAEAGRVHVDTPPGLFDDEFVAANRAAVERRPAARKTGQPRRRSE